MLKLLELVVKFILTYNTSGTSTETKLMLRL